jgi:hypothetical protein
MYVEGFIEYLQHPFYLVDFFVITVSIALEVAVLGGFSKAGHQFGLIVLARIWRFVRVGHGVYEVVHGSSELREQIEDLEERKQYKQSELDDYHDNFEKLKLSDPHPQGNEVLAIASAFLETRLKTMSSNELSRERWVELANGAEFAKEEVKLAARMIEKGGSKVFLRLLATAKQQVVRGSENARAGVTVVSAAVRSSHT